MKKYLAAGLALVIVALAACDGNHQAYNQAPPVQYQPAPVIVQQDSGMSAGTAAVLGMAAGAMVGHSIGSNNNGNYQAPASGPAAPTTVVNRTVVNHYNAPAPTTPAPVVAAVAPAPAPPPPAPAVQAYKPPPVSYAVKSPSYSTTTMTFKKR